jgi:hypothetical protein
MPTPRHRLIETEWPDFGPEPLAAPPVPPEEFAARLDRVRARMEERRLSHLLVYGDREHFANLAWLTNFDPRFEEALLVLRGDGSHPLLVVGNECESYLPISPLWKSGALRAERYQPFSLLDQPRDASRSLQDILGSEGIGAGAAVGCAGWKYYGDPHRMDTPSYIVDTVRDLAGADRTVEATDLFVHPAWGLRTTCSAAEIAFFEYTNVKASLAMRRIHFALRTGMTDHQLPAALLPYHVQDRSAPRQPGQRVRTCHRARPHLVGQRRLLGQQYLSRRLGRRTGIGAASVGAGLRLGVRGTVLRGDVRVAEDGPAGRPRCGPS